MRLLLISSSNVHGYGYLDHAEDELRRLLHGVRRLAFVPYALRDHDGYTQTVRDRFAPLGVETTNDLDAAEAIFVGGGNTFRLLKTLYDRDLLARIRERVRNGTPYIGSSAGTNIAGPTIRTTNDMPIVEPPSLAALQLVPFQLNPHYLDADPDSTHKGETREERLQQYLEENETPVVALREGAMLRVEDDVVTLAGFQNARIFTRHAAPYEVEPGARVAL